MNHLPEPIADRVGHIGGIESLVLDGQTYLFGFDYSSDLVVSPLIESVDVMAQFASRYMEQRDGPHDVDYWREFAEMGSSDSELCSDLASRTFSSAQLAGTVATIAQAAQSGSAANGLSIEYHLLYLLGAAGGWSGAGLDEIDDLIAQLSGKEAPQNDRTMGAIARDLQDALNKLVRAAPGNWASLFSGLQGE